MGETGNHQGEKGRGTEKCKGRRSKDLKPGQKGVNGRQKKQQIMGNKKTKRTEMPIVEVRTWAQGTSKEALKKRTATQKMEDRRTLPLGNSYGYDEG